jgi:hypothetical protein
MLESDVGNGRPSRIVALQGAMDGQQPSRPQMDSGTDIQRIGEGPVEGAPRNAQHGADLG